MRTLITCGYQSYLEAAIGIEPMNKGFADRLDHLSPNTTEYHRAKLLMTLKGHVTSVSLHATV